MNEAPRLEDTAAEAQLGEIVDEFLERLERGERPEVEEYVTRSLKISREMNIPLLRYFAGVSD